MRKSLEAVLDEGLNRIGEGGREDLDSFLAEQAGQAEEIGPLLHLAVELGTLRQHAPLPPGGLKAGRQKLLQETARLNLARSGGRASMHPPVWLGLQALMRRSAIVVTLASILLVVLLGRGTLAASANSLPGDALYPVKRMAEEFRLVFTIDPQARAQLEQELDERRREEAKAIVTTHRVAELSFRGLVEQAAADNWMVGGVRVSISGETIVDGGVALGSRVRVQARSMSDGTLWATRIALEPEAPGAAPAPSATLPSATRTLVPTDLPPTPAPTRVEDRATVVPVEVPPTATPSRMQTLTPVPTATSTRTPVPPTPLPPREVKVRIRGRIQALSSDSWTVDGVQVRIQSSTRIDESEARATVGAMATVLAVRNEDESLVAVEIKVEAEPPAQEQPFEFQGLISSWSETQWVVGGYALIVNPFTLIDGSPQKGLLAEVKSVLLSDGTILAKQISIRLPTDEVQFEGLIQSLSANEWVVDGVAVRIDSQTQVVGSPAVGSQVEVQGLLLPDGAVLARRIVVQTAPELPTPPAEPTATT